MQWFKPGHAGLNRAILKMQLSDFSVLTCAFQTKFSIARTTIEQWPLRGRDAMTTGLWQMWLKWTPMTPCNSHDENGARVAQTDSLGIFFCEKDLLTLHCLPQWLQLRMLFLIGFLLCRWHGSVCAIQVWCHSSLESFKFGAIQVSFPFLKLSHRHVMNSNEPPLLQ